MRSASLLASVAEAITMATLSNTGSTNNLIVFMGSYFNYCGFTCGLTTVRFILFGFSAIKPIIKSTVMGPKNIPFTVVNWNAIVPTTHPGDTGQALWQT